MQKVTNFLEQHVQWVAIGLGALFALWMTWGYIVNSPAKVQVDGQEFTAGQVAKHTSETVAADLQGKISNNAPVVMKVPHPAEQFVATMSWNGTPAAPLPEVANSLPPNVWKKESAVTSTGPLPSGQTDPNKPQALGMAILVIPPTPTVDEARVGRSSVVIPVPPPPAPEQPPADPTGAAPVAPPPPPAPVAQPLDANGQPQSTDKEWVTQAFKISMADLDKAFATANIPQGQLHQTLFLQVEIVRQELGPDGKPIGSAETLKPLEITANGQVAPTYPGDEPSLRQQQAAYEAWALQNQQHILQPQFYNVVKGDQWAAPGMALDQQQQQWTLENPPPNWQDIPEWKEAVMKYRQQKAQERATQKRQAAPHPAPSGSGGRGGGRNPAGGEGGAPGFAPRDNARPAVAPRIPAQRNAASGEFDMPENPAGGAFAPNAANLPQPGVAYPAGAFDPTQWKAAAPIQTWGHDVNVTPGKTYRYKMRYRIKNPLYNVGGNVAKNAKDTQVFACISEFSPWTKPVTVPEKTNFFVARGLVSGGSRVQFEVFKWEDGTQHAEMFDVSPGDVLGAAKNNIDFSTGWTLVGVQNDNVLLVDKDGKLMIRNQKADESDSLYKQLKNLVAIAAKQNPAGGAVGVGPGGVPGVPPTGGGAVPIPRGP